MTTRSISIALAVSILANIFFAAALIGGAAWLKTRHPMIAAGSLRVAGAELPKDERRAFRAALREARVSMRPNAIAGRKARREAAALLRQPNLDQPALLAALSRVRAADFNIRTAVEQRAVAFAATLPQAERARLAEAMEQRADRHHGRDRNR